MVEIKENWILSLCIIFDNLIKICNTGLFKMVKKTFKENF